MDDTLEDVARVIGCEPANVADRVEEIMRENRDLLMDRHGLRSENLKLAEENERLRLSCREAEWAARRCECGADDACAFARERDEARAEADHWKGAAREHAINLADAREECDKLRHDWKVAESKVVAWSSCLHCGVTREWGDFWDQPCGQCEGHR